MIYVTLCLRIERTRAVPNKKGRRLDPMRGPFRRRTARRAVVAGEASAAAAEATALLDQGEPASSSAAFFDVDNTLMRGASIYHFARGLAARDLFTTRDLAKFAWGQVVFRISGNEQPEHIHAAREAALAFVAGHKVSDLVTLCEDIFDDTMADRIWEGSRRLAQRHLDSQQRVWLVTATPVELANILTRRLGYSGALGTVAESRDGVYTGRLVGELLHGPAKAEAVRALAKREGLDLTRCSAYSDSYNDLPLLKLVGRPHAVNPDSDLRRYAEQEGWPIHEFRRARSAARAMLPTAMLLGGVACGIAAGVALSRRLRES
ncbi:HAD superfamily hydrolase (TIGR01490 family) [Allonocardiopsis opalescens]|uniref:HAD superfamily hydrolase (TIGR01490 family) n=2 Tax=Allonocardiopsis opalescens TaxID=1144618 RepID=A0A2T0Q7Q2_9ACTN|nr:HAD superfamily hydrolase (TIGR01490 family) [Allonocardiopsis opalescens]